MNERVWPIAVDAVLVALLACVVLCLVAAYWPVERNGTEPSRPERMATEPNATDLIRTELPAPLTTEERYAAVAAAIGPPPSDDAVPVLGYTSKGGVTYPPRWRTKPDAEKGNNFKKLK